jgi:site-specific DNA-methyltransferase (adenine-specific)
MNSLLYYTYNFKFNNFDKSVVILADCFTWMSRVGENSIHAIITDPPYGIKEYDPEQLEKRLNGKSGAFRHPSMVIPDRHCQDLLL